MKTLYEIQMQGGGHHNTRGGDSRKPSILETEIRRTLTLELKKGRGIIYVVGTLSGKSNTEAVPGTVPQY